jgi:hypothetical protein
MANHRTPRNTWGDMNAQIGSLRVAERRLIELLNGLRVILPGVQVLLAFLLTVPFSEGFVRSTSTDRIVYFATVLLTVAATGALTMPAAYHRIRFRQGDKEQMLRISNVFAIAGLVLLIGWVCLAWGAWKS